MKATAMVLIGGLITSTLLTLVFVPSMYTMFDDIQQFVVRQVHRVGKPRQLEPAELVIARPHDNADGSYRSGYDDPLMRKLFSALPLGPAPTCVGSPQFRMRRR